MARSHYQAHPKSFAHAITLKCISGLEICVISRWMTIAMLVILQIDSMAVTEPLHQNAQSSKLHSEEAPGDAARVALLISRWSLLHYSGQVVL